MPKVLILYSLVFVLIVKDLGEAEMIGRRETGKISMLNEVSTDSRCPHEDEGAGWADKTVGKLSGKQRRALMNRLSTFLSVFTISTQWPFRTLMSLTKI
jgi:hypothetical protein